MKIIGSPLRTPTGYAPLSPAVQSGRLLFLSGQIALRDGKLIGDDVTRQTDAIFDGIEGVLAEAGLGLPNVVKTSVWIVRKQDFAAFNAVYAARFGDHRPARSTVISELAIDGALVEIEVIAEYEPADG